MVGYFVIRIAEEAEPVLSLVERLWEKDEIRTVS